MRRVFSSRLERAGDRLIYRIRGSGFLKHMVRNIVGVLIEVGKGNLSQTDVLTPPGPGCGISGGTDGAGCKGLFLVSVEYPCQLVL